MVMVILIMLLQNRWYALYVRTRFEERIARLLAEKGYESFLPMYKNRLRSVNGIKMIEQPLFPSYLFFRMLQLEVPLVVTTPGVIRIVGSGNEPVPIEDNEISALQTIVASGANVQPWPFVEVGHTVEIESGPLCGLRGIVCRIRKVDRLIVSVAMLRRSVAVEIDRNALRVVSGEPFSGGATVLGFGDDPPLRSNYFQRPA